MSETHIIYTILAFSLLLSITWLIRVEKKLRNLTRGHDYKSVDETLKSIEKDLQNHNLFKGEIEEYLKNVEKRLQRSIQGFHNESFNAFNGLESGGTSFALAFLNENGDGIIVSTLHGRDRINIFSKQISNFKSDVKLSEEEEIALTKAKKSCTF